MLYEETGAFLRREKRSWVVIGAFFVLIGGALLALLVFAVSGTPRTDDTGLLALVAWALAVVFFLLAGASYILIAIRTPGVRVTEEGIFVTPRPVDVLRGRPHLIPFTDLEGLHQGPVGLPESVRQKRGTPPWVLTDTGWRPVGAEDILITRKRARPYLLESNEVSDQARFLEVARNSLKA
ncbi:MAG TPA: hypothetical protein VGR51_10430 [Thermoplasmata archaeon]|nr:hypothetical protein [Thermoplasmata archaeon]